MIKEKQALVNKTKVASEIDEVRLKIKNAEHLFKNTTNKNLISAYIYEIKSLEAKYSYLLEKAKS